MAEITAAARLDGRESVAIFDNLHGQTTRTHLTNRVLLKYCGVDVCHRTVLERSDDSD